MHPSGLKNQGTDIAPSASGFSRAESSVDELSVMYPITTETDIDITAVLLPSGGIQSHHHAMRTAVSETQPPAFALPPINSHQDKPRLLLKMQPAMKDTNGSSTLPFSLGTHLGSLVMEGVPLEKFLEEKQTKKPGGSEEHAESLGKPEHMISEELGFYYSDLHIKAEKNPQDILSVLQNTDKTSLQRECRTFMTSEGPKIIPIDKTECPDLYCGEHDNNGGIMKPPTYVNYQDQTLKREETVSDEQNQTATIPEQFVKGEKCVDLLKYQVITSDSDTKYKFETNRLNPQEQSMQIHFLPNSVYGSIPRENDNNNLYEATHIEVNEKAPKNDHYGINKRTVFEETKVEQNGNNYQKLHGSKNKSVQSEEPDVQEDDVIQTNDNCAVITRAICEKTQVKDNIYGKDRRGMNKSMQFEETKGGQVENTDTQYNTVDKSDQLEEMEVGENSVKDQPIPWLKDTGQKGTHSTCPVELDLDVEDVNKHRNYINAVNKKAKFEVANWRKVEYVQEKHHDNLSKNKINGKAQVGEGKNIQKKEHSVNKGDVEDNNKDQVETKNSHRTNHHPSKNEMLKERIDENRHKKNNFVDKSDQLDEMEVEEDPVKDQFIPWLKDSGQKGTHSTFTERSVKVESDVEDDNIHKIDIYTFNLSAIDKETQVKEKVCKMDECGMNTSIQLKKTQGAQMENVEGKDNYVISNNDMYDGAQDVEEKNIQRKGHSVNKCKTEDIKDQEAESLIRTNHHAFKSEVFQEDQDGENENIHTMYNSTDKSDQLQEMKDVEDSVKDQPIPWLEDTGQNGTHSTFNESPDNQHPDVEDNNVHRNDIYTGNISVKCEEIDIKEKINGKENCGKDKSIQFEETQGGQVETVQRKAPNDISKNDMYEGAHDEEQKNIHRKEHSVNKGDIEGENKGQVEAKNLHRTNHHAIKSEMLKETQSGEHENIYTKDNTTDKSDQLKEIEIGKELVKDQPTPWQNDTGQNDTHSTFTECPVELHPGTEDDKVKSLEESNIITSAQLSVIDCGSASRCTVQAEDQSTSKTDKKDEEMATPHVFIKTPTQDTYGKIIRERGLSLLEDLRRKYLDSEGHGFILLDSGMVLTGEDNQREQNIAFVALRNGLKLAMAIPISGLFLYYNLGLHFYITEQLNEDWYCVKDRITQERMLMKKVPVTSSWGKPLNNFLSLLHHPRLLVPYAVLYDRNGSIHYLMEYKHVLAMGRPPPGRQFDKEKSFWEVVAFLSYCKQNGLFPPNIQEIILYTEQGVCFDPSGLCNSEDPCILKKSIKSVLLLFLGSEHQEHLDRESELLLERAYQCLEDDMGWPEQLVPDTGLSLQRAGPIPFSFPCFSAGN
eukprot:XP_004915913.2 PREDICTED: uncharacterized protein LOC101731243 [Xenopus tropicalis]